MKALLRSLALILVTIWTIGAHAEQVPMGDDGLHKPAWFSITFKDIHEDMETARSQGKRLVLMFEQRGCIYCREVHETVLTVPEVSDYIKEHFMVVQYNIHGAEDLTDLDGEVLSEKQAAKKWRLLFTPTILFLPEEPLADASDASQAAVAMMPGAFKKGTFLEMFRWVYDKGYEGEENFQTYYNRVWREKHGEQPEQSN